jgi:integrase
MGVKKKLLDIVRDKIRFKHYSISTEKTYLFWIKHYIFFHNKKHPIDMAKNEIEEFLTFLATKKQVAPTTQNQAFNAILFLYKEVLGVDTSMWNIQALRAKERKHVPVVLTKDEVQKVLQNLTGTYKLITTLMYGCGLRMNEALNIRIKDIDFGFDKLYIWDSKSLKDRTVPLPQKLKNELMIKIASQKANLNKRVTSHIFRHLALNADTPVAKAKVGYLYATHLLQAGIDLRSKQELLGHKSVETTMIYTHVVSEMNKSKVISPLDF